MNVTIIWINSATDVWGKREKYHRRICDPSRFNLIFEIVDYIKVLVKNFLQSYFRIKLLAVYRGQIQRLCNK